MRIAVIGAGSIGGVFGGLLAEGGHDVCLVDVWREHVEAINRDGLRIEGAGGDRVVRVEATTDPSEIGVVDLVLVLVKSTETRAAAQSARPMIGDETLFLTVQNGLGNRDTIAEVVGEERVVGGVTYDAAALIGPGHVRHTNAAETVVGEMDGEITPRVERVAEVLRSAKIPTRTTGRLLDEVWGKLLVNTVFNASCALTGYTSGELWRFGCSREWARLVAEETAAVARALGVRLPYPDPVEKIRQNALASGINKPSMLQDVERGRWTEIAYINGAVVREGERLGVPTPYNRALTLLVQMLEARQHGEERA